MSFINQALVDVRKPLVEARFPFSRAKSLSAAMTWCATDYYTKASIGGWFEARGFMVIGDSRQGKSIEIEMTLKAFNDGTTVMPDGRPAKIVSCLLSGKVTWKDLGVVILEVLRYPVRGNNSQTEVWAKVRKYAELQGVVGIHFDECQHVFNAADTTTNRKILDSFKSLLKDHTWPLMLILSGIPSLETDIKKEEQLYDLLRVVSFDGIDLAKPEHRDELVHLMFSYADRAGLDIEEFATEDFLQRLAFAGSLRWGLVIELLIEAFCLAAVTSNKICTMNHFSDAFSEISGFVTGYSPFIVRDYQNKFDQAKIEELIERTRKKKSPKP